MNSGINMMLFRKLKNETQREFGRKLNECQQYISELEQQKYLPDKVVNKIFEALDSSREEWEDFKKLLSGN